MPTKDYNIQPYYDDFDETKGYHRILFKPKFAVQARELTQAQTILQDQIYKHSTYENGESISSGQINIYTNIAYVSLQTDLTSSETATSIVGKVITNVQNGTGVKAKIVAVAPKNITNLESLTVYVAYLDNTTTSSTFSTNDYLYEVTDGTTISSTAWNRVGLLSTYTTPATHVGSGSIAQVESGIYYINGFATYVPNQTIILDKYTTSPSYKIGFDVSETTATSSDDTSLNDNAVISNNYQAPGADRHKIQLTLAKRSLTVNSTEGFVEVCEVVKGSINLKNSTSDSKERIVVSGFDYEMRENLSALTDVNGLTGISASGNGNKLSFGVSSGIGKIDGKEVRLKEKTYLTIDKPRTSITKSSTTINAGAELGNYVITDGNLTQQADADTFASIVNFAPASGAMYPLVHFAKTTGSASGSGSFIGTARIRGIERDGLDFKIYLFDIQLKTGEIFSEVSALHRWSSVGQSYASTTKICDLKTDRSKNTREISGEDVALNTLRETKKNALLHEMPYTGIESVSGTLSFSRVRRTFSANAVTSGATKTVTISATNQSFVDTTSVLVYGRDNNISGGPNVLFSSSDLTITGADTDTLTVSNSNFIATESYTVVATVKIATATRASRDLSQQYDALNEKKDVQKTVISLSKTNVHPYSWKVYMSSAFNVVPQVSTATDITSRYTLDTGQRDDYIDFGQIRLKDNQPFPSGRVLIVFWYYGSGAGIYTNAQSYPVNDAQTSNNTTYGNVPFVSNADGGTTYRLSDVPIYTSVNTGKKYRLNDCIDLRPVKNDQSGNDTFNSGGSNGMAVPDKATLSMTGIVQYYGRIDKIYLGADGTLRVKSGVASSQPVIPDNPSGGIPLYNVKLLPYTYDLHDIVVQPLFDDGQRDTDFDAISSLEKSAKDYDLNVGRIRRNTFSDPFVGHNFADVTDKDFSASIDMQKGELRPRYKVESVPLVTHSRVNHTTPADVTTLTVGEYNGTAKNVVTLPYTHLAELQNLNYNAERTLRNTDAVTYNGVVYIKEWDTFKSTKSRPMIKNRKGDFDSIPYIDDGFNAQGTIWNEWETEWYGVKDSHIADPKLDMNYNELDKSPNYYNVTGKEINDKTVEGNYVPYIRSKTITINAYGLKPNCAITSVKFDGIEISTYLTPTGSLYTDNNGKFSKTYVIPNLDEGVGSTKFTTGSKKIVISGNDNYAEGYYHAVGLFDDEGYLTKPYDLSWDDQTNESMFQEFEIFEETCITKLDLYFTAEDLFDRAVTVQIRKMENGKPSNKVLPYSIVSKIPTDFVAFSTGTAVTFTFDETIYLKRGKYAIGIVTPSVEYKIQTLKTEQNKGSKGTGIGNLFIGGQKITDEILRFSLYRAKFNAYPDDAIIKSTLSNPVLNPNPLKTQLWSSNSDATLVVDHEGHGFSAGDTVNFSNIQGRTEHDLFVTGELTFTAGEIVYNRASAFSPENDNVYTVPYGRVITFDNTKKTMSIATESGGWNVGDHVIGVSSGTDVVVANNGVHEVKRLKGLHLGAVTNAPVNGSNNGAGYTASSATGIGEATTNVSGASGGTGNGTGLRVKISVGGGGAITGTPEVIFGGYGYETDDVVAVSGGTTTAQLKVTARGVTVDDHTIMSSGLTADRYSMGGSNLVTLGSSGYAQNENNVTVKNAKRRADIIRYNAKQFVPDGTSLSWVESDSTALSTTDSVDVNTNIPYTQPRTLTTDAVLKLTMSGNTSNDRLSPIFDISSANTLIVSHLASSSNYISRKVELEESANSVFVVFDALLSKGNAINVYAKTMESSSQTTFDSVFTDKLQTDISSSATTVNLVENELFTIGDVISIGEEQMLVTGTGSGLTVTRGYNQTVSSAHFATDIVSKDAVIWSSLSQVGTTFDADFPEYKKMVYSLDNISDFAILQLKINMTASNYSMPVKIRNLKVIPNYKDDSLKPMQTKTVISNVTGITNTDFGSVANTIEEIPTNFVVEEATAFLTEVKNSTTQSTILQLADGDVEILRGNDGKVTPLNTTNNTGCTVRFKSTAGTLSAGHSDGKRMVAVVILTGRRV